MKDSRHISWTALAVALSLIVWLLSPAFELIVIQRLVNWRELAVVLALLVALLGLAALVNRLSEIHESPEFQLHCQQRRLAGICCDRLLEFLAFAHPLLAVPQRRLQPNEWAVAADLSTRVWALTDSPPEIFIFALGAINHRAGRFEEAAQYLSQLEANEGTDDWADLAPDRTGTKLSGAMVQRAYDQRLRELNSAGQALTAEQQALAFFEVQLSESRRTLLTDAHRHLYGSLLNSIAAAETAEPLTAESLAEPMTPPQCSVTELAAAPAAVRPPITEVLRQVYDSSRFSDSS